MTGETAIANTTTTKSSTRYGGYLLGFEPKRSAKIAAQLETYSEASESFSAMDWNFERRELVLLALTPGKPDVYGIALMERMHGSGGTGKLKMRISDPVLFGDRISVEELKGVPLIGQWLSTAERLNRIEHSSWVLLLNAIKSARPHYATAIDNLAAKREELHQLIGTDARVMRLMEQRDAVGIALDMASLDRKKTLKNLRTTGVSTANSVLDLLDSEPLQEQDVIRHDQQVFKNLLSQEMKGVRFKGPAGREVRIYVYDKKPLETLLGVDLLIYQESYQSFLLLQYKTMEPISTDKGNSWSYLVNRQLAKQIAAMDVGNAIIADQPGMPVSLMNWRLHNGAFYFKFCETTRPNARDDALVSGITLGLDHLKQFLALPQSDGENGGKRVGYNNCPRYLNNSQFLELAREGWIGCDTMGLAVISKILAAKPEGGKAAMYAVIKGSGSEFARNRRKRF